MARIGSQGFVDDGSDGLQVDGVATVKTVAVSTQTLDGTTAGTISTPGYYQVAASGSAGAGLFTGTLPAASAYPGSTVVVADTYGQFAWALTGSSYTSGKAVFVHPSGSLPGGLPGAYGGTVLNHSAGGSVVLLSDGYRWIVLGGSGSMPVAGLNL